MSQQVVNLKIKGLYTAANDFSGVPDGALDQADDVVIDYENLVQPRRGFSFVTGTLPLSSDRVNNFTNFQNTQIISYKGSKLAYYSGGAWNTYSGNYLPPDVNLAQVRFFEANKNLYISTSNGVYKLDTYSATPVLAGIPKGLDLQLALTGASGFFSANVASTVTATTTNASANLTLVSNIGALVVGQYVFGVGIPTSPAPTITSITQSATVLITTGNTTAGSADITSVNPETGLAVGQLVTGIGIPAGARITVVHPGAVGNKYTLSLAATQTATGVTLTFASDPIVTLSANATASGAVSLDFSTGGQVGYRVIWGLKDANQNLLYGSPSQFASITNNTGASANVQGTSSIPSGITTAHFYQVYRSAQTSQYNITPLDDEQLVLEANPNPTDIANGYIQFTDIAPDSLKGQTLYTSISQQGISQSNDQPPYCKDFCSFRNYAFYANTKTKQRLNLTILAIGGSNGIAANDTLTIGGFTFTADTSENTATGHFQVFTSGTPAQNIANTANSLIKVINRYATNTAVYAYLLSGPTDLPGQILLEEKGNTGTAFVTIASAHGSAYSPTLPTSGVTVTSTQSVNKNGVIISKSGIPEAAPGSNLVFVGSASKEILRIIPLRDYIILLKEDGIYRISGQTIQNFTVSPFDLTTNIIAPNTAVSLSNEVWGLFDQGVCSVSDTGVNVRSRPIEDVIRVLFGTALSTLKTVAFGIKYETDRKYILALPGASGDTAAQQEYVFSTITNTWTRWTRVCTAGFVDPTVDKLYLGNNTNAISVENKADTYQDYVDEAVAASIVSSNQYSVVLSSINGLLVGDVLWFSSTVNSVITAINISTNTVTVQDLLTWGTGAAFTYPAIKSVVQWKPASAGNPAFVRQYSEGGVVFKRTRFNSATLSFYSDVDQSYEDTTLVGAAIGNWGIGGWGQSNWGGVNRPKSIRFLVPQNKQMCSQLSARLTVRNGYSNWALEGLALTIYDASQEIAD